MAPSSPAPAGPRPAAPRTALIVTNPRAGTNHPGILADITDQCCARLDYVDTHVTTGRADATAVVRDALAGRRAAVPDLVVAVGGDGTVREVIEGMTAGDRPSPAALVIVPAGTGNSGYRMVWGERPWQDALHIAINTPAHGARLHRLDLARLTGTDELVFLGACSGIIAQALETARGIRLTGPARYARALAETATTFKPYPGRVTVDGTVLYEGDTVFANVGGGRIRGGRYLVLPRSLPDDGLLDVCVVGGDMPPGRVADLTLHGRHLDHPATRYGRGRTIAVERLDGEPLVFEYDGELQGARGQSMTLEVLPGRIPAWIPAAEADRTRAA
ncbi:diacylglycerol/lipid kinase family protein [Streptomyces broussonetiae]|uniref:diacylglycerol/lipid kinase family protein n=1 Tax=Streptomyces broussonetiae TaxID=2686304 RepID=UPI0035DEC92E